MRRVMQVSFAWNELPRKQGRRLCESPLEHRSPTPSGNFELRRRLHKSPFPAARDGSRAGVWRAPVASAAFAGDLLRGDRSATRSVAKCKRPVLPPT